MINGRMLDAFNQYGRGIVGAVVGQTYTVYRLNSKSEGSILSADNAIYDSFPIEMTRDIAAETIEQTSIYDMVFAGMCDATRLQVGDIAVLNDGFRNDSAKYIVAQLRPSHPNVFVRVEIEGMVSRQDSEGAGSEVLLGAGDPQYTSKEDEKPFILRNGYYYIEPGNPAVIPFGLQPYKRLGPTPEIKQPTTTHRNEVFIYVPLLRGLILEPGDVFTDQNGNRYRAHTVSLFTTGLQGYQLIGESIFT